MISIFSKIFRIIPKDGIGRFYLVCVLIILNGFLDLLGLSSIIPLLAVLFEEEAIQKVEFLAFIYNYLELTSQKELILVLVLVIFIFIVLKNIVSIFILRFQAKYSFYLFVKLSIAQFRKYYEGGYQKISSINTTVSFKNIYNIPFYFAAFVLLSFIQIINEVLVVLLIVLGLLYYDYRPLVLLTVTIVPIFLLFYQHSKNKMRSIGNSIDEISPRAHSSLNEILYGYRDMIISNKQVFFFNKYEQLIQEFSSLNVMRMVYLLLPSKISETTMIVSILVMTIYGIYVYDTMAPVITLLSLFALASFRILPSINRLTAAMLSIRQYEYVVDELLQINADKDLTVEVWQDDAPNSKLPFSKDLKFEQVQFSYDEKTSIFSGFDLTIKKGDVIGVIGKSGSGKSTLFDLLLGFQRPDSGIITIDGVELHLKNLPEWRENLALVQQNIYVLDASLAENIAYGIPKSEIDIALVEECIDKASLREFVSENPDGIWANMGEMGTNVSGGQKQRIGIARALYSKASILLFDEATSALDMETENEIIESINNLVNAQNDLTIIIIAHRITTLRFCDRIIELESEKQPKELTFDEIKHRI